MLEAVVSQIRILDGDLGKSGQTTTGREDFHQLMATVTKLGNISIYRLAIEAGMDRSSLRRIVNGTHGAT